MPGDHLEPLPVRPGDIQKTGSEYVRKGTCSIFIFVGPLSGWRHASVQEHRTAVDWAFEIKYLLTECHPDKETIILVMDNLNTHVLASLYKCFPAPEARSHAKRPEIHYTPKHGSWLNIAEIELNVMTRQCLSRRIADINELRQELAAWETDRNRISANFSIQLYLQSSCVASRQEIHLDNQMQSPQLVGRYYSTIYTILP